MWKETAIMKYTGSAKSAREGFRWIWKYIHKNWKSSWWQYPYDILNFYHGHSYKVYPYKK